MILLILILFPTNVYSEQSSGSYIPDIFVSESKYVGKGTKYDTCFCFRKQQDEMVKHVKEFKDKYPVKNFHGK